MIGRGWRRTVALALSVLLLGLAASAPERTLAQEHEHEAASDTSVAARLHQPTAHLEQMLNTLRGNPSLEERSSSPAVLEAAVASGRRGEARWGWASEDPCR